MAEGIKGGAGQWRDRYLKKIQQIEKLENQHSAEVELLRRALVSVSLVVDGIDADLRHSLSVMRRIFRGDQDDRGLDSLLKKVQVQSRSVRERNTPQQSVYQLQRLIHQLEPLPVSRKLKRSLQKLSKEVDNDLVSLMQTPTFLKSLAILQEQLVEELQASGNLPEAEKPFWQRLLGGGSGSRDEEIEETDELRTELSDTQPFEDDDFDAAPNEFESGFDEEEGYGTPEPEEVPFSVPDPDEGSFSASTNHENLSSIADASASASSTSYSSVGDEVSRVVQNLVDQLSIPKSGSYQHLRLQQQLMRSHNWYELIPLLESTVALVLLCMRHGRSEFTTYLQGINEQLLSYIAHLEEARNSMGYSLDSSENLTQKIEGNISHLETSMAGATSLGELKEMVGDHLQTLMKEVDEYKEDLSQSRESQEKLQALGEQVQLLESQTEMLKTDLVQEQQRALRDALTGLPNRLAYDEQVQRELARSRRYKQDLTLVVADIDFFKKINDQYGHLAGDKLLRIFARQLLKGLREADFIARYGGEEFALLLPNTSVEEAQQVVEKIRQTLVDTPFRYKDEQLDIRASYGIAAWDEAIESHEQLFEYADIALYSAKTQGRDRFCVYSEDLPQQAANGSAKADQVGG